jgi:hypothetical protein
MNRDWRTLTRADVPVAEARIWSRWAYVTFAVSEEDLVIMKPYDFLAWEILSVKSILLLFQRCEIPQALDETQSINNAIKPHLDDAVK